MILTLLLELAVLAARALLVLLIAGFLVAWSYGVVLIVRDLRGQLAPHGASPARGPGR